jgi:hypothetical protein
LGKTRERGANGPVHRPEAKCRMHADAEMLSPPNAEFQPFSPDDEFRKKKRVRLRLKTTRCVGRDPSFP